jgi:hypothetical protein
MAATKSWAWGDLKLASLSEKLDYGAASANTRVGVLGTCRAAYGRVKGVESRGEDEARGRAGHMT